MNILFLFLATSGQLATDSTRASQVTYRQLSRAVQVHVNTAKQYGFVLIFDEELNSKLTGTRMLYEFHRTQNAKRPGAVHATYLINGTKKSSDGPRNGADGDVEMGSSPPEAGSLMEAIASSALCLVPEERLEGE
jgi:DNA polymerase delta subunit 3